MLGQVRAAALAVVEIAIADEAAFRAFHGCVRAAEWILPCVPAKAVPVKIGAAFQPFGMAAKSEWRGAFCGHPEEDKLSINFNAFSADT
ncbi:MAG: hypothetical protein M5R36_08750 [Deltaproteobacteria bacterium]|nr:hypothetical protein [Deltaproteobacteria bacterium]